MADKKIPLQQASCLVRRLEGVADLLRLEGDHDEADVIDEAVAILKATPPAAPDLQAELDATNRQVEILSDALAESRREVAALKAVQEPVVQEGYTLVTTEGYEWAKKLAVSALAQQAIPLTELQKDATNLLFALHDAWPYVHQHCTIQPKKKFIQALIVKHGDFADLQPPAQPAPVQEPVAKVDANDEGYWADLLPDRTVKVGQLLYTTPLAAQRQWVGLTDDEIDLFINGRGDEDDDDYVEPTGDGYGLTDADLVELVRRAEAKLKERNT